MLILSCSSTFLKVGHTKSHMILIIIFYSFSLMWSGIYCLYFHLATCDLCCDSELWRPSLALSKSLLVDIDYNCWSKTRYNWHIHQTVVTSWSSWLKGTTNFATRKLSMCEKWKHRVSMFVSVCERCPERGWSCERYFGTCNCQSQVPYLFWE